MWCWRRHLRVPWTARLSNQSILKEINSEYSLERLMIKMKLQYFGHLMGRVDSLEKTLMLGKFEGRRRRGWQRWCGLMVSLTQWTWFWINSGRWWRTGKPGVLQSMRLPWVGYDWETVKHQNVHQGYIVSRNSQWPLQSWERRLFFKKLQC